MLKFKSKSATFLAKLTVGFEVKKIRKYIREQEGNEDKIKKQLI